MGDTEAWSLLPAESDDYLGHILCFTLCGGDSYAMGVREGRAAAIFCLNWNHIDTYLVSDTAEVPSTVLNSLKAATFEDCRADREGVEGGRASCNLESTKAKAKRNRRSNRHGCCGRRGQPAGDLVRDLPGSCRVAHGVLEEVAQPTGTALQVQCSSPAGLHMQNHFFEFPSPASIN